MDEINSFRRIGRGNWRARPFGRGRGMGTARGNLPTARGGYHYHEAVAGHEHDAWKAFPSTYSIGEIISKDLQSSLRVTDPIGIEDCEFVASYSWLNRKQPTILVPGEPPAWSPPATVPKLDQDSGTYFRDPNAARYAKYPTEPIIRAAFATQPDFDPSMADIVACGSTMGNLLRFAGSIDKTFRFEVELIGDTVFMVRKENSPQELIPGVYGYGHTFPEAYTTWAKGVKDSVSNQRLVKYSFAGIECHVRFESDGYLPDMANSPGRPSPGRDSSSKDTEIGSLLSDLNSAAVSEKSPNQHASHLIFETGGRQIPQAAIFDIKTRAARSVIKMDEVLPRLWVSQIPNFIIAYHKSGNFDDIQVRDVEPEIAEWEKQNQPLLRRFHATLLRLTELMKQSNSRKFEVRRIGTGPIRIWKQDEGKRNALPHDLRARWSGQLVFDSEDSEEARSASEEESDEDADSYLRF
ncbi:hypothetical protein MMC26_007364 [Xylographa opegraphella]|nr:hypothetical protein [Xylographa opegraphella]